jgi:DNA primase
MNFTVETGWSQDPNRIDTEALKRERPLADVVAACGVALRRESAGTFRGLCPFHTEHTPSFWIDARDPDDAHYFCYGCLASGDVIQFIIDRESCSFREACEQLAQRGRPPVRYEAGPGLRRAVDRCWEDIPADSSEGRVLELASQVYRDGLARSAHARAYLKRRGVPEDLAANQQLGYADGRSLLERLQQEDGSLDVGIELGLVLERPAEWGPGPRYREFFADRLIVPELRQGRSIWFIGRAPEEHPTRRPRYLSLRGQRPLLGLEVVQGRHGSYVVEGPFDWLAARAWRLPACCLCGTHTPPERLPALEKAVAVYGLLDPDRAGLRAAERLATVVGARWRPVHLPDGMDLAELAACGPAGRGQFDALVRRARSAAWLNQESASA